ncbi:putative beta-tubulin polyglutamylase [Diplonema papillatum]|nr:putative beta-tubulin polyglutamylase [Diplonema papillatum]
MVVDQSPRRSLRKGAAAQRTIPCFSATTADIPEALQEVLSPCRDRASRRRPWREKTYWMQGMSIEHLTTSLDEEGWVKVDLEEGRPPHFARYRRSCKAQLLRQAYIRPYPYSTCLTYCCDKKMFYASMCARGYTHSVPETYTSYQAVVENYPTGPHKGELWYVKTSDGCHGRGVKVFDDFKELKLHVRSLHNEPYVIQRGVSRLNLIDGKKWTIRSHVAVTHDLKLYCHRDGVVIVHADDYNPESLQRSVQILHNNRATRFSLLGGPAAHLLDVLVPQIERISFEVCDCIRSKFFRSVQLAVTNSSSEAPPPKHYALLGLDLLVDADNVVHCLEVNEYPQLDFSSDPDAHAVVVKTWRDFLALVAYPLANGSTPEDQSKHGWYLLERQLDFSSEVQLVQQFLTAAEPAPQADRKSSAALCGAPAPGPVVHSTDPEKKILASIQTEARAAGWLPAEVKLQQQQQLGGGEQREPGDAAAETASPKQQHDSAQPAKAKPAPEVLPGVSTAKSNCSLQQQQQPQASPRFMAAAAAGLDFVRRQPRKGPRLGPSAQVSPPPSVLPLGDLPAAKAPCETPASQGEPASPSSLRAAPGSPASPANRPRSPDVRFVGTPRCRRASTRKKPGAARPGAAAASPRGPLPASPHHHHHQKHRSTPSPEATAARQRSRSLRPEASPNPKTPPGAKSREAGLALLSPPGLRGRKPAFGDAAPAVKKLRNRQVLRVTRVGINAVGDERPVYHDQPQEGTVGSPCHKAAAARAKRLKTLDQGKLLSYTGQGAACARASFSQTLPTHVSAPASPWPPTIVATRQWEQ